MTSRVKLARLDANLTWSTRQPLVDLALIACTQHTPLARASTTSSRLLLQSLHRRARSTDGGSKTDKGAGRAAGTAVSPGGATNG